MYNLLADIIQSKQNMEASYSNHQITLAYANALCCKAVQSAEEKGVRISISVMDTGGREVAFMRMDNAPLIADETARRKARFAVGFSIPTGDSWYQFIKDDPILMHGAPQLPDFILLGGGSPIRHSDRVIGAIGISGGHYKTDEAIIEEVLKA